MVNGIFKSFFTRVLGLIVPFFKKLPQWASKLSNFIFKITKFRIFLFFCIVSFPMFCPEYDRIMTQLGTWLALNNYYYGLISNPWIKAIKTPISSLVIIMSGHSQSTIDFLNLLSPYFQTSTDIVQFLFKPFIIAIKKIILFLIYVYDLLVYVYHLFSKSSFVFSLFIYCGIFFFSTTVFSFFLMGYLGLYGVFITSTISLFIFWISSIYATFFSWLNNASYTVDFGKWFTIHNDLTVNFDFYLDNLSMAFALLVLTIAFFINVYTFAYFRYEPNVSRLMLFINVFVISMVVLVTAANMVLLYFGWEMIGITSFFLINFWATRMGTVKAAFKAFVFNKFSDCFILIAAILIAYLNLDFNISVFNDTCVIHTQTSISTLNHRYEILEIIAFCFMISAFIKSAQFGFHIWLPDSMEAPVPASALIHSATLVSAGVFLILRFHPLFELIPYIKYYIIFFGSLTSFFGGICSIFQTDVKRLLAYSTISHCGVLMFLTFFKNPDIVIIYLYVHGFFKAIIFMCMGHVIRFANNYQDMRRMGGFYKYLPFEALLSFVALLNLAGVSFSWGFYMKHFLFIDGSPESILNLICFVLVIIGSLSGLIYSFKLYYYVFFDFKKGRKNIYFKINNDQNKNEFFTNASLASNVAILGLTIFAYIFCGYLILTYLSTNIAHFDWSYFYNFKNNVKNFNNQFILTIFFYINWGIVIIGLFILLNNWKNSINPSFKINFFINTLVFLFFFYIFYVILIT